MGQIIEAKVAIQVPDSFELVSSDELSDLRPQSVVGRTWTMNDLRDWLGHKQAVWVKDNILYNPRYSKDIQAMINHNEIRKSKGNGSPWLFKASTMAAWLDKHWEELPW